MENVRLIWATPDAETLLAYIARVSNPDNQENKNVEGLFRYMLTHGHVSPFEMASMVVEINTTRDIGRQILRHRSFSFQEFSGRYQSYDKLPEAPLRECRLQDLKNRQSSLETDNDYLKASWAQRQSQVLDAAEDVYKWALKSGIAKEQARAVLPEGLTTTRMYMAGTLRSWIHYLKQRLDPSTQKEHREIAQQVRQILAQVAPIIEKAADL